MNFSENFRFSVVGILLLACTACQQANTNQGRDKKLQQQQQKFDIAVQRLQNQADNILARGKGAYDRAARSVQEFSNEAAQKVQEVARATDKFVEQAQSINQVPEVFRDGSNLVVAAAQTAVGYVSGPQGAATPQADRSGSAAQTGQPAGQVGP